MLFSWLLTLDFLGLLFLTYILDSWFLALDSYNLVTAVFFN